MLKNWWWGNEIQNVHYKQICQTGASPILEIDVDIFQAYCFHLKSFKILVHCTFVLIKYTDLIKLHAMYFRAVVSPWMLKTAKIDLTNVCYINCYLPECMLITNIKKMLVFFKIQGRKCTFRRSWKAWKWLCWYLCVCVCMNVCKRVPCCSVFSFFFKGKKYILRTHPKTCFIYFLMLYEMMPVVLWYHKSSSCFICLSDCVKREKGHSYEKTEFLRSGQLGHSKETRKIKRYVFFHSVSVCF